MEQPRLSTVAIIFFKEKITETRCPAPIERKVQYTEYSLWKEILSQQRIRHFKILQSIYFAYDVGIISTYSNRTRCEMFCFLYRIQLVNDLIGLSADFGK